MVAIASLAESGLHAQRARPRHLAGPALISYEADIIVLMNAKSEIVSEGHIADDARRLSKFARSVVFSVEKNRSGEANVDLDFRRDFAWFRFDPAGVFTQEHLIDEALHRS